MNEKLLLDIYNNTRNDFLENSLMDNLQVTEGRYLNLTKIASGGMKHIHTCIDSHTDREIVLLSPKENSPKELFVREAFINAYLQHPNISPVYDIGLQPDGIPYFTTKLIKGISFKELPAGNGYFEIIDILIKICEAVSYAHSRSLVHQDLKPENIMIDSFGELIIIDWGLAEIDDSLISGESSILDKELQKLKHYSIPEEYKSLRGTPGFIAPERYRGARANVQNDIFSIGALLSSKVSEENREIPLSIKAICDKATHEDSRERYQSVDELLKDLQNFRHGYATTAESASLLRSLALLYRRNRKFCLLILTAAMVILSVTLVSFILVNKSKNLAILEKDKALKTSTENLRLLEELKEKEQNRQHFMRLSAKNQLLSVKQLLKNGKLAETELLLDSTLKLDPDSYDNMLFKAQFELAGHRLHKAAVFYDKLKLEEPLSIINSLDLSDADSILQAMPEISKLISSDLGVLFCQNSIMKYENLEIKAEFYKWLIFFSHPGMKRMPSLSIEQTVDGLKLSFANNFSIKDCGPVHILNPKYIDLSNTNFQKIPALFKCKNLIGLNLKNTPLISLSDLNINSLKELNISKTVIKNLNTENFPGLETLNVSNSPYKQFKQVREFKNLKTLIIDENQSSKFNKPSDFKLIIEN